MAFARIDAGFVAELFTPPAGVAIGACFNPGLVWVDVAGAVPAPHPGWAAAMVAGAWTFAAPTPPPAPAPSTQMSPLAFIGRFTGAEQTAIGAAAMSNVSLWLWFNKMTAATYIDLADPETKAGLDALVSAGLLAAARETAILAP